ncbi:hypothetical protein EST38_g9756 [Candolleomyces aberdarensis]|uniref:Uncharacterized protein n=1 Tax=Candolleomyces aberdarensis TaxID=2316362 RepID=A0A4Q2D953_9AGAR|nr:hypothetical protein EST38_g9756 [Candolleomyces aberdarensis]
MSPPTVLHPAPTKGSTHIGKITVNNTNPDVFASHLVKCIPIVSTISRTGLERDDAGLGYEPVQSLGTV